MIEPRPQRWRIEVHSCRWPRLSMARIQIASIIFVSRSNSWKTESRGCATNPLTAWAESSNPSRRKSASTMTFSIWSSAKSSPISRKSPSRLGRRGKVFLLDKTMVKNNKSMIILSLAIHRVHPILAEVRKLATNSCSEREITPGSFHQNPLIAWSAATIIEMIMPV